MKKYSEMTWRDKMDEGLPLSIEEQEKLCQSINRERMNINNLADRETFTPRTKEVTEDIDSFLGFTDKWIDTLWDTFGLGPYKHKSR